VEFIATVRSHRALQWLYSSRIGSYRSKIPCSLLVFDSYPYVAIDDDDDDDNDDLLRPGR
jgi:hypothetical protein